MGVSGVVAKAREGGSSAIAVGWAIFLLLAAGWTVLGIGSPVGLGIEALRGPARTFLATVGAGAVMLWPMVRLSQPGGRDPGWRAASDAWAVMLPTMASVAPLELLVRWGWGTTWLVVACLSGWVWAAGGVVALGSRDERASGMRAGWMMLCVGMAVLGPGLGAWLGGWDEGAARGLLAISSSSGPSLIAERGLGVGVSWWAGGAGWIAAGVLWGWVWLRTRIAGRT